MVTLRQSARAMNEHDRGGLEPQRRRRSRRIALFAGIALVAISVSSTSFAQPVPDPTADGLIPANRVTTWRPGVTYNGGIPNRTTIFKTISPRGGDLDDTANIQAALDSCPPEVVVQLTPGTFNINGRGLIFSRTNCTLRGAGPGAFSDGSGGTRLVKADRTTGAVLYVQPNGVNFGQSIDLAMDAMQGTNSLTLVGHHGVRVGEIVYIDENTDDDPEVFWGPSHNPPGGGSRRWFIRQDRSLAQMMEVTAVSGDTITFNTPFHSTFKTAYQAQLTRFTGPLLQKVGVEDLYVWGGESGDYHGNISVLHCAYCWVRNVNAAWSVGTNVGLYRTFRSEVRDSYIHETPDPNPGGAGYMTGMNYGASDNLFENNIMWYGNKEIVMRGTGGGNVVAYNYMDDSFGSTFPHGSEGGLNAGHYTTPHMELLEGNYSQNYVGDSYWGNSINITVFRNWLSALRAAHPPLDTYTFSVGTCTYRYGDYSGRTAVSVQAYAYDTNFIGNILGMQNQQLLGYDSHSCFASQQTGWQYENLDNTMAGTVVSMWQMGSSQTGPWVTNTYQTQLRQGNWDWVTKKQTWHGIGGAAGSGTPQPIPNSLYLTAAPPFFGNNRWPWVDPATGTTYTLPAKYCFEHNQMPTCLQNGSATTPAPLR
jgi:hypothetical protein